MPSARWFLLIILSAVSLLLPVYLSTNLGWRRWRFWGAALENYLHMQLEWTTRQSREGCAATMGYLWVAVLLSSLVFQLGVGSALPQLHVVACAVQSYILVAISKTLNSPAWTWPFNIVVLCTLSYNPPFPPSSSLPKEWFLLDDYMADFDVLDIVKGILIGVSQIFVVENWISGLLILIGLSVHDVKLATSCLTGSVVGLIVGLIFQAESSDIKAGLWGFNPALTAAAVYTFCAPSRQMCVFLVISACVTQILAASMARIFSTVLQIPIGTVPFCMVATFAFKLIGHLQGITFRVAAPVKVESSQQIDGKDSIDGVDVVVGTPLCTPDKEFFC